MVSKYAAKPSDDDALVLRMTEDLLQSLERPEDGASLWCQTLVPATTGEPAKAALNDLLAAERTLVADPPLSVVPQIGMNIAVAPPEATAPEDILAFPGRMVAAGDRLVSPVPPAWGASKHLAACLLALAPRSGVRAIANILADADTVAAAQALGLNPVQIDRGAVDHGVLRAFSDGATCVHDPGAHGIEPCLYITGETAEAVAEHIQSIHAARGNPT